MSFAAYGGSNLLNHKRDRTPPTPRSFSKTSLMAIPAYSSSSPRSSLMDETKFAGFRTKPSFFAQVKSIGTLENEKKGIKIVSVVY
jgi:hypothetical protein